MDLRRTERVSHGIAMDDLQRPNVKLMVVTTIDMSLQLLLGYQLRRFVDEGFEVIGVSAPGPFVEALRGSGVRHVAVPTLTRSWTPLKDLEATATMFKLFRRERPDIVHTHTPKSGVLGRLAGRLARVPVIVNTVHGLYGSETLSAGQSRIVLAAERLASRLSDHELFQSREDFDYALATGMVRADRATWLGNGVDLVRFDPAEVDRAKVEELRRSWGAGPSDVVVGTVGRLVREKGYPEFFESARTIGASRTDVRFVAVGPEEPSKSDGLGTALIERATRDGVVFHGAGIDMPAIYAAFDIFVLASRADCPGLRSRLRRWNDPSSQQTSGAAERSSRMVARESL